MSEALKLEVILESVDKMTAPTRSALGAGRDLDSQIAELRKKLLTLNKTQKDMTAFKELKVKSTETGTALEKAKANAKKLALQLKDNKLANQGLAESLELAQKRTEQLALELSETEEPSKKLNKEFKEAQALTNKLTAQFRMAESVTGRLSTRFESAKNSVNKLKNKQTEEIRSLDQLRAKFKAAGISSKHLQQAQKDIATQTAKATQALDDQARKLRQLQSRQKAIRSLGFQKNRTLQAASNMTVAGAGGVATGRSILNTAIAPMQEAMTAESARADIKKVTNFTPEELKQYGIELDQLTWKIPLAYEELAAISASAGQLGIAEKDIKSFTVQTAKMSTAFDMLPDDAGDSSAKLMNVYNLTVKQMGELGDAINHLSDNSAAKANQMVEALGRVGGIAKQFGLTEIQAAALTNAFIALGKPPEVASTAINSMLQALQIAPQQGKKFQAAMAEIGVSSEQLANDIANNPQKALLDFMKTLKKLDKKDRAGIMVDLFGKEFSDDISLLVGNLDKYQDALTLTAEKEAYLGSMQREFETRSETRANQLELLNNQYMSVRRTMGDFMLNAIMPMMPAISGILTSVNEWLTANPELAATIGKVVLGLGAAITVMGGLTIAIGSILAPIAMLRYGFGLFKLSKLAMGFMFVARAIGFMGIMLMANPIVLIAGLIAGAAILIYNNWEKVKVGFITAITAMSTRIQGWVEEMREHPLKIVSFFLTLPVQLAKLGIDAINGFIKGMFDVDIKASVTKLGNKIVSSMKGVLGIHSPSRVFRYEIGNNIAESTGLGVQDKQSKVQQVMHKFGKIIPIATMAGMSAVSIPAAAQIQSIQKAQNKPAPISTQQSSQTTQQIEININAAPGMDEHYLADLVEQKLRALQHQQSENRSGYLFDGADR